MELKSLVNHVNKVLDLEPPVCADNEEAMLRDLESLKDDLNTEDYGLLSRSACRELLKRNLVPETAMEIVCKKAGRKPPVNKKPVSGKKKAPVKKPVSGKKKAPVKKEETDDKPSVKKQKKESNEAMASRFKQEGKKIGVFKTALRKKYESQGKVFDDEWLEKRANIYWKLVG